MDKTSETDSFLLRVQLHFWSESVANSRQASRYCHRCWLTTGLVKVFELSGVRRLNRQGFSQPPNTLSNYVLEVRYIYRPRGLYKCTKHQFMPIYRPTIVNGDVQWQACRGYGYPWIYPRILCWRTCWLNWIRRPIHVYMLCVSVIFLCLSFLLCIFPFI